MGVNTVNPEKVKNILCALGFENPAEFKDYLEKILPRVADFNENELKSFAKNAIKAKNVASCPFDITEADELEIYKKSLLLYHSILIKTIKDIILTRIFTDLLHFDN